MKLQFKQQEIPDRLRKYFKAVQCEKGCYICHLIQIFAEVKRVLKPSGTMFINLGDSYNGSGKGVAGATSQIGAVVVNGQHLDRPTREITMPRKSLMNIPARFAIAMTDELQFINRNRIIWHKPACMPSSAKDRFTVDFEDILFFAKNPKYKFNQQLELMAYPNDTRTALNGQGNGELASSHRFGPGSLEGRNKRTTWRVSFEPQKEAHYASWPTKLVEPMILAGTDEGDTVLDIFAGTGTTLLTALRNKRNAVGIELNPAYIEIAERRLSEIQVKLF